MSIAVAVRHHAAKDVCRPHAQGWAARHLVIKWTAADGKHDLVVIGRYQLEIAPDLRLQTG
jgi:adenine deaminase